MTFLSRLCDGHRSDPRLWAFFFFFLRYFLDSVQLLSHVRLLATAWTAAHQVSLFITKSWNLLKLMSIESVMPSNHFILCPPIFLNIFTEFVAVLLLFYILFFFCPEACGILVPWPRIEPWVWVLCDLHGVMKSGSYCLLLALRELGTSCLPKKGFIWASWRPCH